MNTVRGLAKTIDEAAIIQSLNPDKDVDGFHRQSVGGLVLGTASAKPCMSSVCMRLLRESCGDFSGSDDRFADAQLRYCRSSSPRTKINVAHERLRQISSGLAFH